MDMQSTRDAYGDALVSLGEKNNKIVVLDADLSVSTQTHKFFKKFPERSVNVGCAEQNLIGVAAGLAISGKIPFVSTYAIFLSRAWEQIRNTIAYDSLNVKMAVSHSGFTNAADGASHQSLEDIAIMRVIPNMRVIVPADSIETKLVVFNEAVQKGPSYIRLNREKTPIIFDDSYSINDNITTLREGTDIAIFATGSMTHVALEAHNLLKADTISSSVINVHTIKPLDKNGVVRVAKNCGVVISIEEHSVIGGLGSAISDVLTSEYPIFHIKIGVDDTFGESGDYKSILKKHNLTAENVYSLAKKIIERKRTFC
ncbi:MAG: transketolase C-terminal domain-containing protein [Methanoregula sp.]